MTLPLALLWLCRLRSLPWAGVAGTARSELRAGLLLGTDPHSPPAVPSPSLSPGGTRSLPVPAGSPAPGRQPGSHLRLVPPPGAVPSHALAWQAAGGGVGSKPPWEPAVQVDPWDGGVRNLPSLSCPQLTWPIPRSQALGVEAGPACPQAPGLDGSPETGQDPQDRLAPQAGVCVPRREWAWCRHHLYTPHGPGEAG